MEETATNLAPGNAIAPFKELLERLVDLDTQLRALEPDAEPSPKP